MRLNIPKGAVLYSQLTTLSLLHLAACRNIRDLPSRLELLETCRWTIFSQTHVVIDKFPLNFLCGNAGLLLFTELCICYNIFGSCQPYLVSPNFVVTVSTFSKIVDDILNGAFWNVQISSDLPLCCAIHPTFQRYPLLLVLESPFLELRKDCEP